MIHIARQSFILGLILRGCESFDFSDFGMSQIKHLQPQKIAEIE